MSSPIALASLGQSDESARLYLRDLSGLKTLIFFVGPTLPSAKVFEEGICFWERIASNEDVFRFNRRSSLAQWRKSQIQPCSQDGGTNRLRKHILRCLGRTGPKGRWFECSLIPMGRVKYPVDWKNFMVSLASAQFQ